MRGMDEWRRGLGGELGIAVGHDGVGCGAVGQRALGGLAAELAAGSQPTRGTGMNPDVARGRGRGVL